MVGECDMKNIFKRYYLCLFILLFGIIPISVNAASISLNRSKMLLGIGVSEKIKYTISDDLNDSNIVWTSSNPKVATVNNGKVTAITNGTTVITASVNGYSSTCLVTVSSDYVALNGISLNMSKVDVLVGDSSNLSVSFNPSNASNKDVVWTSSNSSVVSVDGGKIIGKKVGTAIITVSSADKSATCVVNVVDKISLNKITISKESLNLKEGDKQKLTINYIPGNATNKKVKWSSSNDTVVGVDNNGNVIAKKAGSATITVVSNDGGYTAQCSVKVEAISKNVVSVSLDKSELELRVGSEDTLNVKIDPDYAINKDVSWSSSNPKVASVKDGVIKALSVGTTEIKVVTKDGNKEAVCKVSVISQPIESISFSEEEITVYLDSKTKLVTVSSPDGSILENPIWVSSNPKVAVVENGVVEAKAVGSTIVSVSNEDGTIKAEITINVTKKPKEELKIEIDGYKLDFNVDKKDYVLEIGNEETLNIKVNRSDDNVVIKGNNSLKNGSIVTITIDDDEKVTYIINIKKKENYTIVFISIISVLLLINLIRMFIKNKKKS